jgi:integrase
LEYRQCIGVPDMATVGRDGKGWRILFVAPDGARRTVRLGQVDRKTAESICRHVEALLAAKLSGQPVQQETAVWLGNVGDKLRERLARAGLTQNRPLVTLGAFIKEYIDARQDVRPLTRRHLAEAGQKLTEHFGAARPLASISEGDANEYAHRLFARYSPNTARRMLGRAKQLFAHAVRKGYLDANPFGGLRRLGVKPNKERDYYVSLEETRRLLDVLPTPQWRALFCLARFCGLRVPSEVVELTWQDVNWETDQVAVRSSKTEREGKGYRLVPLFPEARRALSELFDAAEDRASYIFPVFRHRAQGPCGLRNANLRTQLERYILLAGLKPWPKLFSNLRRSAAIDLAMRFPSFAVAEWLGHTEAVSQAFYLRITPELQSQAASYTRLAGDTPQGGKQVAQIPAQYTTEKSGILPKLPSQPIPQTVMVPLFTTQFCVTHPPKVPPEGLEPSTP